MAISNNTGSTSSKTRKAFIGKNGNLSLIGRGRPSDTVKANLIDVSGETLANLLKGKRVKYSGLGL